MKTVLQAIVVRHNNKTIYAESIADGYTDVSFFILSSVLDSDTKRALESCNAFLVRIVTDGYIFNENNASTICGTYGNLTITIEKFIVDII